MPGKISKIPGESLNALKRGFPCCLGTKRALRFVQWYESVQCVGQGLR